MTRKARRRAGPWRIWGDVASVAAIGGLLFLVAVVLVACDTEPGDLQGQAGGGQPMPDAVGGLLWIDEDGDGAQGVGEPGAEGIAVELHRDRDADGACAGDDDEIVAQTISSAGGRYTFEGVDVGSYCVVARPDASDGIRRAVTLDGRAGATVDMGLVPRHAAP